MSDGYGADYFNLERGARQDDSISAYFFILILGILFILTKSNGNIHGIKIFMHEHLYIRYGDDTTF